MVWGTAVWAVRDGPAGPRVSDETDWLCLLELTLCFQTLCHNCGLLYERDKVAPEWSRDLHRHDIPVGR